MDEEISALVVIYLVGIQRQLLGTIRNVTVITTILNTVQEHRHIRDPKQCCKKIKALKKYKVAANSIL